VSKPVRYKSFWRGNHSFLHPVLVLIWAGNGCSRRGTCYGDHWLTTRAKQSWTGGAPAACAVAGAEELFGGDFQNNKDAKTAFHRHSARLAHGWLWLLPRLLTWARAVHVEQFTYTSKTCRRGQTCVPGAWWGGAQPRAPTSDARHLTVASRFDVREAMLAAVTRPRGGFPIYGVLAIVSGCVCSLFREGDWRTRSRRLNCVCYCREAQANFAETSRSSIKNRGKP
jgi:hypothetical protein